MRRCVRQKAAEEAEERKDARTNAAKCKAERDEIGAKAFAEKYGKNRNVRNAFGKCVSTKVREA